MIEETGIFQYAWDLDNTLINTRAAHFAAYKQIGITPPEDFHLRPWKTWCSQREYDRKQHVLEDHLKTHAQPTTVFWLWKKLGGPILTLTSLQSILVLEKLFPELADATIIQFEHQIKKVDYLLDTPGVGIYFDDNKGVVTQINELHRCNIGFNWRAICVTC